MLATDGPYCLYIHCASEDERPAWSNPQRTLAHYLLVCSVRGEEQIRVAGQPYLVRPGQSYLVVPGVLSDLGSLKGSRPAWIHFDVRYDPRRKEHPHARPYQAVLGERARFLQPSPQETWGVGLPVLVPAALAPVFKARVPHIVELWRRHEALSTLEACAQLNELLLTWVAYEGGRGAAGGAFEAGRRIQRAELIARQSLGAGFGVRRFAEAARMSRSHFCQVYRRLRGTSPGAFLRQERLCLAEVLLARSELPVAEIAGRVGYGDATVFGRVFKAARGMTPSAWRLAARRS